MKELVALLIVFNVVAGLPTLRSSESCDSVPLLKHPTDCNAYFECRTDRFDLRRCPGSLHFNYILQQCDRPENANCTIIKTNDCETNYQVLPHPDCSMFYSCAVIALFEENCEDGMHWSVDAGYCMLAENAGCVQGAAPFQPDAIPINSGPSTPEYNITTTIETTKTTKPATTTKTTKPPPTPKTTKPPTTKTTKPSTTPKTTKPPTTPKTTKPPTTKTTKPPTTPKTTKPPTTKTTKPPTTTKTTKPPTTKTTKPPTTPKTSKPPTTKTTKPPTTPKTTKPPTTKTTKPTTTLDPTSTTQSTTTTTNQPTTVEIPTDPPTERIPTPPRNDCADHLNSPYDVLLPHPICTKFYQCVWGQPVEKPCSVGLHFNADSSNCDYPAQANCVHGAAPEQLADV